MLKMLLIALSGLLLLPNFIHKDINPGLAYDKKEKFDPAFSYINSIGKLDTYTDSIAREKNIISGSFEYVELLEAIIEQRFYHGFSHFSISENWIAAFAGRIIKEDYACKVKPDQIMQHPNAACSQQAMVMMAVLRKKGTSYRSIGFPHHYAMEVLINNEWYFFDANMEPGITKVNRKLSSWQHHNDYLKPYYDTGRFNDLDFKFGNGLTALIGTSNEIPAQKASIFHTVTGVLSRICWIFPLLLIFYRPGIKTGFPFAGVIYHQRNPTLSLSS